MFYASFLLFSYDWWTKDITWVLMEVLDGGGLQDLLQSQVPTKFENKNVT